MKVLLINGSPRKRRSNTLVIAEAFLEGMQRTETHEIYRIEVASSTIGACLGCFTCWKDSPGRCVIKDDMGSILQELIAADVVIWSFPLYYYGLPSGLKALVDRMLPLNLPVMEETPQGSASHPARYDLAHQKHVLLSSCGFWSRENNYESVFAQFDIMFGKGQYTRITCPEGELLGQKALHTHTGPWLEWVRVAGHELSTTGSVSPESTQALEGLILPPGTYQALANASWGLEDPSSSTGRTQDTREIQGLVEGLAGAHIDPNEPAPTDTRSFIAQMAVLYNPRALEGKEAILEMAFSDTGECHRLLLGSEAARLMESDEDPGKRRVTRIETSFATWTAISSGEIDGAQALMDGRYRVLGNFDLMLKMDQLFSGPDALEAPLTSGVNAHSQQQATGRGAPVRKPNLSLVILPWLAIWIAFPISTEAGVLSALAVLGFLFLAGHIWELGRHERIAGALVAGATLGFAVGLPASILLPLSYLAFGAHWILSCFGTPLTAAYSKEAYGGDAALANPLFIHTNRIITLVWGMLYLATAVWTIFLLRSPLAPWTGLLNGIAPLLCGIWTAWFPPWYIAYRARGGGHKQGEDTPLPIQDRSQAPHSL